MLPQISIIIPAYNNQDTIERCLKSAMKQTLKEIELIVINDGSTDQTARIVEQLSKTDPRILLIHQDNQGQGCARNVGLAAAKGAYIGFLDSDDIIESEMYEKMLTQLLLHEADMVECNMYRIFSQRTSDIAIPLEDEVVEITNYANYFDNYLFTAKHSYGCCNKLIKKSFLNEHNIQFYPNSEVYAEDLLFNLDLAMNMNKVVFIKEPLYHYYQNEGSHSNTTDLEKVRKFFRLFQISEAHAQKVGKYKELKYEIAKLAVLVIMINAAKVLDLEGGPKEVKTLLAQKEMKNYLYYAQKGNSKLRHKALMWSLCHLPLGIRAAVIKKYYTRWDN